MTLKPEEKEELFQRHRPKTQTIEQVSFQSQFKGSSGQWKKQKYQKLYSIN